MRKTKFFVLVMALVILFTGCSSQTPTEQDNSISAGTEVSNHPDDMFLSSTIPAQSTFEIHFIDVGQGDAALVLCDGNAMLIDGGESSKSSKIYAYLQAHSIDFLDYIVATHAHSDHIGGLSGALNYEELCRIYQGGEMNRPVREVKRKKCLVIASPELPIATSETRNNTYSNLLSLLSLSATHRESLLRRGLSGKDIDALGYRTTPAVRAKKIVTELLERGCDLKGVPGFYCDKETGRWMMDVRGSGIMLPIRSCAGEIESIQVRLDKVYDSKFYTFTSVDKYCGATAIGCPHFVGVKEGMESVYLTEGVMKSDIAHCISGYLGQPRGFVGLTGVTKYSHFERALHELQTLGIKRINLAYDMDALENANVREAKERIISMGIDAGFDMIPLSWDATYKGVDDLFVSMLQNKLKA